MSLSRAHTLVSDPAEVARHSFWPLIFYEKITRRFDFAEKKARTKKRPIMYASHSDSHLYSYYAYKIREKYESFLRGTPLNTSVIAYRPLGKSNIDFANEAFDCITKFGP